MPWAGENMRIPGELDEDYRDLTFGTRVVLSPAKHMPPASHTFIDRYFTGIPAVKLAKQCHGVLVTGTIKSDRPGIPWQYLTDWDQESTRLLPLGIYARVRIVRYLLERPEHCPHAVFWIWCPTSHCEQRRWWSDEKRKAKTNKSSLWQIQLHLPINGCTV